MIFNGNDIRKLIDEENILENCSKEYISSGSCDISMSNEILKIKKTFKTIDLSEPEKVENMYEKIEIKESYNFKPNEVIFVILNEKVKLPDRKSTRLNSSH